MLVKPMICPTVVVAQELFKDLLAYPVDFTHKPTSDTRLDFNVRLLHEASDPKSLIIAESLLHPSGAIGRSRSNSSV